MFEDFEGSDVPARWRTVQGGSVQLSGRHYKDGQQSLQWTWADGSRLRCDGLALSTRTQPGAGMQGWIYREVPVDGRLTFRLGTREALAKDAPEFVFRFGLNFTGWRMFRVQFERDCRDQRTSNTESRIEILEIVPPGSAPEGCVWIDAVQIGPEVSGQRSADFQIPEHAGGLGGWCEHWPLHYARQTPTLPLPATVTEEQKRDFATISARYFKWLLGGDANADVCQVPRCGSAGASPSPSRGPVGHAWEGEPPGEPLLQAGAEQFQAYIRRGWAELESLKVVRGADGRIVGPGLVKEFGRPTSFKHVFYDILMPLVFDYRANGNDDARRIVLDLFDYIHDQGWAEGSGLGDLWLNALGFAPYCHAVVLMRDELRASGRLETAVRAAAWYLTFGKTFSRFDEAYIETNADALRGIMFTSLAMILAMDDAPRKVQYMRGWLAWYNDALRISPRFTGLIKPDGLGFHHQAVYAGAYATCAYEFCSLIAWMLHGTQFAADPASIANLKLALTTQDTISNTYDVPYATMGRMPHPGVRIFSAYAYLALAGGTAPRSVALQNTGSTHGGSDDSVEPVDPDLAGIFMRLWDAGRAYLGAGDKGTNYLPQVLNVDLDAQQGKFLFYQPLGRLQILQELADRGLAASPKPEGFFSKPWGALAVHRRGDWLVSVKGWSQYVWDFEMHPKCWAMVEENVYARYWSYGTLQPITHGRPTNPVDSGWNLDRGWDWCRWPGATSKHLALDELYDPKTTWASRFFSAASFVGGVSSEGRNGLFALKLHEHYYDPTFRAFKTYFFFENAIICLGSNIESRDEAHAMATTLFQSWMSQEGMPVRINGEAVAAFPYEFQGVKGEPLTLMDPYGNGYVLPDGGAVRLSRSVQRSRDAWNRGATEGAFSTCWLDHGHGPREDGYGEVRYHYALLLQVSPETVAAFAKAPPYRVLQQNHQAHVVEHAACRTMAYALFETDWIIPHGIVRRTDTPVMVMVKTRDDDGLTVSLADPDLRLPKRRNMGYLDDEANATPARPSVVRVELRGKWRLRTGERAVRVLEVRQGVTVMEFVCRDGMTIEVQLEEEKEKTAGC